jgi:hypothetical protein
MSASEEASGPVFAAVRTLEVIMFLARKNAETQSPGVNDYDNITVRYYPGSNRYIWFIDGKRAKLFTVLDALAVKMEQEL